MNDELDATLAILAGGEGSRMGRPKGLLQVGGQPILRYLLDRFAWKGPKWLVTAPGKENPPGAAGFDRELVDPQAGLGPLRGVLTALESIQTAFLVVVTVDMPLLESTHLRRLLDQLQDQPDLLGLMYGAALGPQPFPLALRKAAQGPMRARLESGRRSVQGLLDEPGFQSVAAPKGWDPRIWTNLNEPGDLREWSSPAACSPAKPAV